jgi:hypothetical protein
MLMATVAFRHVTGGVPTARVRRRSIAILGQAATGQRDIIRA